MIELLVRGAGATVRCHITEPPALLTHSYVEHIVKTKRPNGTGGITKAGYIRISRNGKLKYEHIEVAERALGRPLPKRAKVHHVDKNQQNNVGTNLVICPDQSYHALLHQRMNAMAAGAPLHYKPCRFCGGYDDPKNMKLSGRSLFHAECRSSRRRAVYLERKAHGKSV